MLPMIRAARPDDAPGIARVQQLAWPDDTADAEMIASLIERGERSTHVAVIGGTVVGYADGFLTRSQDRVARWEVDLLAVAPGHRGMGTAARLIEASTLAGAVRKAAVARALIHVDNTSAQRAFSRLGFTAQPQPVRLVVSDEDIAGDPMPPNNLHLIPVRTFTYRGFWLEGNLSRESFYAGQRYRMVFEADLAGAVIPLADRAALDAAGLAGYTAVGDFHWWVLPLI